MKLYDVIMAAGVLVCLVLFWLSMDSTPWAITGICACLVLLMVEVGSIIFDFSEGRG